MTSAQRDINRKLRIFEHAKSTGNVSKTCRYFGISRTAYYDWKKAYKQKGEAGLINQAWYAPKFKTSIPKIDFGPLTMTALKRWRLRCSVTGLDLGCSPIARDNR